MTLETSAELVRRVNAAQATLDEFKDRPFRLGVRDCVRLTAAHLRRLGHHVRLPPEGSYRSTKGAIQALAARGFVDIAAALDALEFERAAPAAALVGDIVELPSERAPGAIAIMLTNGRLLGYHQDAVGAVVMQPRIMLTAWRVTT